VLTPSLKEESKLYAKVCQIQQEEDRTHLGEQVVEGALKRVG